MEYYKKNVDAENKNNELNFCSYLWFCALGLSNQIKESEYKETISVFKKTSQICTYSNSYKNRLAYRVYRLFGLSICRRLLGSYLKIKKHRKLHTKKYTNQQNDDSKRVIDENSSYNWKHRYWRNCYSSEKLYEIDR